MKVIAASLCLSAALLALPVLAAPAPTPAPAEPAPATAVAEEDDKVICKKIQSTGSHFKRRVCHKSSVWREQRKASQEEHRRMMSRPSTSAPG